MKRLVSLILVFLLLLSIHASAQMFEPAELPDYLDVYYKGEQKFNIKNQDITLRVAAVYNETNGADMTNSWITAYIKKHTGITLEWEMIPTSAKDEQLNLLMLGDDLPDILFAFNLGTSSMIRYGSAEKQLLDMAPYINEETMPALTYILSLYPEWKTAISTAEGSIYSLPRLFGNTSLQTQNQGYINQAWLAQNGFEMPKTLDELNTVLYAFKAANPKSTPLGGGAANYDPRSYILNAFGFVNAAKGNSLGLGPAVSDNKAVIPVMEDKYFDFLKLMNQYYKDGIINEEFFTMTEDLIKAQFAAETTLYIGDRPTYFNTNDANYHSVYPLTSKWNDAAKIQIPNSIVVGGIVVSAETEYPEAVMAMLDWWYTDEGGIYSWSGAMAGEDTLGMYEGWRWSDEAQNFFDPDTTSIENGGNGRWNSFHKKCGSMANPFCNLRFGNRFAPLQYAQYTEMGPVNMQQVLSDMEVTVVENTTWDYITNLEANKPYLVEGWPSIVWMSDETSQEISYLSTSLSMYVESEVAKFITGARELNEEEWNAFQKGLKDLQIDDYLDIYKDIYSVYLAARDN